MTEYKVTKGDTLSSIAKKFSVTISSLVNLNRIKDPNIIKIGQKLQIPDGSTVIVEKELITQTFADAPAIPASNKLLFILGVAATYFLYKRVEG